MEVEVKDQSASSQSRRRSFSSRTALLLVVSLVATLFWVAACGDNGDKPAARSTDYHLDPPGLAEQEIGDLEPGVPVLCYHYFRAGFDPGYMLKVLGSVLLGMPALGPREFWTTPVGEFEKHLRYFQDTGTLVMTLDEVADLVEAGGPLPERAVVLTIDDADRSVYEQAYPLLRKYGFRAHLFVPTGHVNSKWSGLRVCDWNQLREMSESGTILIGSHTRSLHFKVDTDGGLEPVFWHPGEVPPDIRTASRAIVTEARRESRDLAGWHLTDLLTGDFGPVASDLLASRVVIRREVGDEPRWLAWPYGFADGKLDSVAAAAGFRGTVSLRPVTYGLADGSGHVGRFTLTAKTTLAQIAAVFPDNTP